MEKCIMDSYETEQMQKAILKFMEQIEVRIMQWCAQRWLVFLLKVLMYSSALINSLLCFYFYYNGIITSSDFCFALPFTSISSSLLVYIASNLKTTPGTEILFEVGANVLSEFFPTNKKKNKSWEGKQN